MLLAPAWAQADPNADFATAVMRKVFTGDAAGAAQLINTDKPRALESFQVLVNGYASLKDPKQQQLVKGYVNTVARVFEAGGDPSLVARLKAEDLLAVQAPASPSPSPEPSGLDRLLQLYLQSSSKASRYGNYTAANQILTSLEALLGGLVKLYPQATSAIVEMQKAGLVLQLSNMVFSGMAPAAINIGEQILELTKGNVRVVARLCVAAAARTAARPQVLDKQLALLRQELPTYQDNPSAPLWNFVALSWAAERELQKNPDLPLTELLARHDEAWKALASYKVPDDSQGDGHFLWDGTRLWTTELSRRLALTSGTDRQRVQAAYDSDLDRARALSNLSTQVKDAKSFNPEFLSGMFDFLLDEIETLTRAGKYAEARKVLGQLAPGMQQYHTVFADHEKTHRTAMAAAVAIMESQVAPPLRKQGLTVQTAPLDFSLLEGDVARVEGRVHQVTLRLLMAETGGNLTAEQLTTLKDELQQTLEAQIQASKGQVYLGMDDVNWDLLNVLFTRRKGEWQKDAAGLVAVHLEAAEKLNDRPGLIAGYAYDGELKSLKGDQAGAIASLKKATGLAEDYITEVGATASGASQIRARYRRAYDLLTRLQIETGQAGDAYDTLGRRQQMEALSAAGGALEGNPVVAKAITLRGQTDALHQEIATLKAAGQDTKPAEQLLARTKGEFFTALNEIRRTNPKYESMLGIRPVNFSKQQSSIPADAAIVQYFPGDDGLYIFIVTREDLKIRKVDVREADLKSAVTALRQAIVRRADVSQPATRLHSVLIDPVETDVAAKPVLAFIPTGALNYLPFPALARSRNGRLEYLAERKQCAILLKSSDLDQLSHKPSASRQGMLALGNPDGSLPAATEEVKQIAGLFGGKSYVGVEARRETLAALPKGGVAYLHLATHGTLDAHDPAASYLLMAGKPEEARLLVPQIYELNLNGVRLVTLSACQTALGEREPGSELQTLADAFGVAGSNSVVASYWSVADESTRTLMIEFYRQLKAGRPLAQALNGAQLSLLKNPKFSHPFYWAPFVLIGDWR